jgi:hypothetical protein
MRYRPFLDGPWRLAMGLKALDLREWIEVDADFADQLAERRRLLEERHHEVCAALPEAAAGEAEVLELLLEHLPARFPDRYRRTDGRICNLVTGERFELVRWTGAPLELAGRLVQEDLCLLQGGAAAYRLVAGVLCFPSHWRLADKLGRPLAEIHEPVPGFAEGLAATVDRFFGNLQAARPVWRVNWSTRRSCSCRPSIAPRARRSPRRARAGSSGCGSSARHSAACRVRATCCSASAPTSLRSRTPSTGRWRRRRWPRGCERCRPRWRPTRVSQRSASPSSAGSPSALRPEAARR